MAEDKYLPWYVTSDPNHPANPANPRYVAPAVAPSPEEVALVEAQHDAAAAVEARLSSAAADLAAARRTIDKHEATIGKLSATIDNHEARDSVLQSTIARHEATIARLNADLGVAQDSVRALQSRLDETDAGTLHGFSAGAGKSETLAPIPVWEPPAGVVPEPPRPVPRRESVSSSFSESGPAPELTPKVPVAPPIGVMGGAG